MTGALLPSSAVPSCFPRGADAKTVLALRATCSSDELFKTLWCNPDFQVLKHKRRGDTNLVEHPWVHSKEDLPAEKYSWKAPSGYRASFCSPSHRFRKVRFESPPAALAAKNFLNEELQTCTVYLPGQVFVVEAVSCTSAPYGDKFNILFRYTIKAESNVSCTLHVEVHIDFLESINRLLKPVVIKAVDGGLRSTFKIFRSVLETLYEVQDFKALEAAGTAERNRHQGRHAGAQRRAEEEAHATAPHQSSTEALKTHDHASTSQSTHLSHALPASSSQAPGAWARQIASSLVYDNQVKLLEDLISIGVRSGKRSHAAAQCVALVATLWLLSVLVSFSGRLHSFCTSGSSSSTSSTTLCQNVLVSSLPTSTAQVLASLCLVAVANVVILEVSAVSLSIAKRMGSSEEDSPSAGADCHALSATALEDVEGSAMPMHGVSGGGVADSMHLLLPLSPFTPAAGALRSDNGRHQHQRHYPYMSGVALSPSLDALTDALRLDQRRHHASNHDGQHPHHHPQQQQQQQQQQQLDMHSDIAATSDSSSDSGASVSCGSSICVSSMQTRRARTSPTLRWRSLPLTLPPWRRHSLPGTMPSAPSSSPVTATAPPAALPCPSGGKSPSSAPGPHPKRCRQLVRSFTASVRGLNMMGSRLVSATSPQQGAEASASKPSSSAAAAAEAVANSAAPAAPGAAAAALDASLTPALQEALEAVTTSPATSSTAAAAPPAAHTASSQQQQQQQPRTHPASPHAWRGAKGKAVRVKGSMLLGCFVSGTTVPSCS